MMRAAPLALSGLLALILAELMKLLLPALLPVLLGVLMVILKVGLGILAFGFAAVLIAGTFFAWRIFRQRRNGDV